MRVAYDLYNQSYGPKHSVRASQAAQLVRRIDRHLQDAKKIFAVSKNVQTRLKQYNGLDSELLYHSLPNEQLHYPGRGPCGYILSVGRLIGMERVDLLIKAMAYTKQTSVVLLLAREKDGLTWKSLLSNWESVIK